MELTISKSLGARLAAILEFNKSRHQIYQENFKNL